MSLDENRGLHELAFCGQSPKGVLISCDLTDQLAAGQRWTATRDEDHIAVLVRVEIRGRRRPLRMLRSALTAHRAECLASRHSKSAGRRTRSRSAEVLVQQIGRASCRGRAWSARVA